MQTITQKKKLSKGTWMLIILLFAAVIGVAVAAALGYIDLAPYADMYVSVFMWGSTNIFCSLVLTAGFMGLGGVFVYIIYNYFRGQKVAVNTPISGYNPQPTAPSTSSPGSDTVIS